MCNNVAGQLIISIYKYTVVCVELLCISANILEWLPVVLMIIYIGAISFNVCTGAAYCTISSRLYVISAVYRTHIYFAV